MISCIVFNLGESSFKIEQMLVSEVVSFKNIHKIALYDNYLGFLNLRGKIIPLIDLSKKILNVDLIPSKTTCVLICTYEDKTLGLVVDNIENFVKSDDYIDLKSILTL